MQDNLGGDVKKLKSALEELAIAFGELIIPVVRDVVAVIQEMVNDLNALDEPTKRLIVTIAAIAAALGPVLIVVGKVVSLAGMLTTALGTLMPILTAIATTVGGFIATALVPILPIIAAVGAAIAAVIVVIKNWDSIVELAGMVFEEFRDLLLKAGNAIKTGLSNAFKAAGNAIKGVFNNLKTWASNVRTALVQTFTALGDAIKARATGIGTAVVEGVSKAVNFIKDLPSKAYTWGTDMIDSFINGIKKKIANLQEALRGAAQKVKDFLGFSEPKEGPLSNFHTFAPDMMDLFAKGIKDSTSVVTQALQASANQTANAVQTDYTGVLRQIATNTGATSANTGRATGDINIALKVGSQQFGRAVLKAGQLNAYRTGGH
jgi:phage-related protein